MEQKETLKQQYDNLEWFGTTDDESVIHADSLLTFPYEYPGSDTEVSMDTDEFTAVCPWTGLPDFGTLVITYVPSDGCLELKSVKYSLLGYRNVGIVQEHAANRILNDLAAACEPKSMTLTLDYNTRGGLHTVVTAHHPKG